MDTRSMNIDAHFVENDDNDENFEAFIANRRCQRNLINPQEMRAICSNSKAEGRRRPPQTIRSQPVPVIPAQEEVEVAKSLMTAFMVNKEEQAEDFKHWNEEDEFPMLDQIDSPLHNVWQTPSPVHHLPGYDESSLFVQQSVAPTPVSQHSCIDLLQRLIPADYDSDSESRLSADSNAYTRSSTRTHTRVDQSSMTRAATVSDPFAKHGFMKTIKQNPYTSGLFEYQSLTKEEAYERLGLRSGGRKNLETERKAKETSGSGLELRREKQTSLAARRSSYSEPVSRPAFQKRRLEDVNRPILPMKPMSNTRQRIAANPPAVQQGHGNQFFDQQFSQRSTASTPSLNWKVDNTALSAFIHDGVRKYEDALTKLNSEYIKDSTDWQLLEAQIKPDIDKFTGALLNPRSVNDQAFQRALEIWDVDIGLRTIVQKYIMYSSLLETISLLGQTD